MTTLKSQHDKLALMGRCPGLYSIAPFGGCPSEG